MNSFSKLSIAIATAALAAVSGSAQTTKTQSKDFEYLACPVLQAERSPGLTEQVPVGKNGSVSRPAIHRDGQHLELRLINSGSRMSAISAIRITIHGWRSGTASTFPARKSNSHDSNATRTLDLAVSLAPHATASKDVWVSGLASVDSIDVDQVKYADGSSWESSTPQVCRIMPNPIMLISSK